MTDAPPSPFPAGVTTTRSRSSYIREPNVDYSNSEVAERVARMHEQRAAEIRAGLTVQGSPSTPGSSGSESSAIRGPGRRVVVVIPRSQMTPVEEEVSPSRTSGGNRGVQVQRTQHGGTHIRFDSDGEVSSTSRG
jgi:hypothetical protein